MVGRLVEPLTQFADAEQRGMPKAQTEEWWRNFNDPVLDRVAAEAAAGDQPLPERRADLPRADAACTLPHPGRLGRGHPAGHLDRDCCAQFP